MKALPILFLFCFGIGACQTAPSDQLAKDTGLSPEIPAQKGLPYLQKDLVHSFQLYENNKLVDTT